MKLIAKDVWQLSGFPSNAINVYLTGDVLIDAGTRWAKRRILRQLGDRSLSMVALTHCHPDHQGTARFLCEKFGIPLACHERDVDVMEGHRLMQPRAPAIKWTEKYWAGPPHKVGRVLRDGDEVAGFRVVHAPGHTAGHVIYFREADRVAIAGDVLANIHFLTGVAGLREPPAQFSVDPEENRRSMFILLRLQPAIVCFGHGPPLRKLELLEEFITAVASRKARPALAW
jgi:glyoxylase-like metal-dependent hydrolase (beta-lactamase superfamily II)